MLPAPKAVCVSHREDSAGGEEEGTQTSEELSWLVWSRYF